MAKIIDPRGIAQDQDYEPPYTIAWGVCGETTGTETITMGRTIIPPRGKNKLHHHRDSDATFYVAKGPIYVYVDDGREVKRYEAREETFIYSPAGVIHGQENPSPDKEAMLIFTYGGVPSKEAAGTIVVEGEGAGPREEATGDPSRVRMIYYGDLPEDKNFMSPLSVKWGVDSETTGTKTITMGRTLFPPGYRNRLHYHKNCDDAAFLLKGRLRLFVGEKPETYEVDEGQFIYVPKGEIHGFENMNKQETAEFIFTYGKVPNKKAAGTVFVEDA